MANDKRQRNGKRRDDRIDMDHPSLQPKLEKYISHYEKQGVFDLQDANERENLENCLKTELPICFWISARKDLQQPLITEFEEINNRMPQDIRFKRLNWYAESLFNIAYKSTCSRREMRKFESYKEMHEWLKANTENGNIVRQEEVSMIPSLLLELSEGLTVLDMCAAPGSKTCQIVEMLRDESIDQNGFVVANDSNFSRCHILAKRVKSLNYPNCLILNSKAQDLSNFIDAEGNPFKFDRVICDVPCSGDGTIRKDPPNMIQKWSDSRGSSMHRLQLSIAKRGMQLLKPGGILIYSTCSLNPIENEAVVAELLEIFKGQIELVDAAKSMPKLKTTEGVTKWSVHTQGREYENYEEIEESFAKKRQIKKSFFPPEQMNSELKKCIRILPHKQNSGGFFVAKFTKTALKSTDQKLMIKKRVKNSPNPPKKFNNYVPLEIKRFTKIDQSIETKIMEFYGIDLSDFKGKLYCRSYKTVLSDFTPNKIYFLPDALSRLMCDTKADVRIIMGGICLFSRNKGKKTQTDSHEYRLLYENVEFILPFLTKQRVENFPARIALRLVESEELRLMISDLEDENAKEKVKGTGKGSVVLLVGDDKTEKVVCLRSENSLILMVGKSQRNELKLRLERLITS